MNKRLLDILVCPFDKVTPLELLEFESDSLPHDECGNLVNPENKKNKSQEISSQEGSNNNNNSNSNSNSNSIVKEGLLLCNTCNRFYPITEEIPIILPDELRDKKKDVDFLKKWREAVPRDLIPALKPWTVE